jgi:dihydrofolate reductase
MRKKIRRDKTMKLFKKVILAITVLRGGEDIMVTVYVTLIIYGAKTFDQVPASLKPAVKAELLVLGLDENGHPIAS